MGSNSVQEFERRYEAKKKNGLVDLKFCTTDAGKTTPEEFCAGANAIDDALDRGDFKVFTFGDSTHK